MNAIKKTTQRDERHSIYIKFIAIHIITSVLIYLFGNIILNNYIFIEKLNYFVSTIYKTMLQPLAYKDEINKWQIIGFQMQLMYSILSPWIFSYVIFIKLKSSEKIIEKIANKINKNSKIRNIVDSLSVIAIFFMLHIVMPIYLNDKYFLAKGGKFSELFSGSLLSSFFYVLFTSIIIYLMPLLLCVIKICLINRKVSKWAH